MAAKKNKAVFIVKKYPMSHPDEDGLVPAGSKIDLGHLPIEKRAMLVDRGLAEPTTKDALVIPAAELPLKPPKLNKYGLPFGQVPAAGGK